jgi:hypothetical protein
MRRQFDKLAGSDRESQTTQMLLSAELATGLTLAGIAETKHQTGDGEGGKRAAERAEEVYSRLVRLLADPKHIKHINDEERQALKVEMVRLRKNLDGIATLRQERQA